MKRAVKKLGFAMLCLIVAFGIYLLFKRSFVNTPVQFDSIKHEAIVPDLFDSGNCFLSTEALPKSDGVDMEMYYQCQWQKSDDDSAGSTLVRQYASSFGDSLLAGVSLDVSQTDHILTDDEIDKASTKNALIKITQSKGEYISSSNTLISGFKSERIILKKANKNSCVFYLLYIIFKGDRIITITYMVSSNDSNCAYRQFYSNYIFLFQTLANKTRIF
jgi:hypothetical protein